MGTELDHKEDWGLKNWCLWTVVLEKTLESLLDCKIKPVKLKGSQPWIFIGRIDAEVEAPILWPPDISEELTPWKRPWCWERLKARGEGDDRAWDGWMTSPTQWMWVWASSGRWYGQGSLVCCGPRGRKESDTTERLNNKLLRVHESSWHPCRFLCACLCVYWEVTWRGDQHPAGDTRPPN